LIKINEGLLGRLVEAREQCRAAGSL